MAEASPPTDRRLRPIEEAPPDDAGAPAVAGVLERTLDALPHAPGVYAIIGPRKKPIYVGKAKDLHARVRSYFRPGSDGRVFHPFIAPNARDVEVFVCENEVEALILENNLIKQYRPRYNIKLVDDKTYLLLKVTLDEEFPRLLLVRRARKNGGRYYGPFASASALKRSVDLLRRHFPVRTCTNAEFRQRVRPCLQHQIGRCDAPCVGLVGAEAYRRMIDLVLLFLDGKDDLLLPRLEQAMAGHAERMEFEQAARVRDQIEAVRRTLTRQRATRGAGGVDRDVFALGTEGGRTVVQALYTRDGKLQRAQAFSFDTPLERGEVLLSFLKQHYAREPIIPPEILLSEPIPEAVEVARWLADRRGHAVRILVPKRGWPADLVRMALRNASLVLRSSEEREAADAALVDSLGRALGLGRRPSRIECFDISNFQGVLATGSQVTFVEGRARKDLYRKYRIKTVRRQDDFAMIREVVRRRLVRGTRDGDLPDLLIIDGGRGQLAAATEAMAEVGVARDVCGLAKARIKKGREAPDDRGTTRPGALSDGRARARERVFLPGEDAPRVLEPGSPELSLLERIRDEAHRFAVGYHRQLRSKDAFRTGIEEIPGIGPARRRALLDAFGSVRAIREASPEALAQVKGIGPREVLAIREFFAEEGAGDHAPA